MEHATVDAMVTGDHCVNRVLDLMASTVVVYVQVMARARRHMWDQRPIQCILI